MSEPTTPGDDLIAAHPEKYVRCPCGNVVNTDSMFERAAHQPHQVMSEPTTEAGKALLNAWKQDAEYEDEADFIVAIEQEARANADRELREALDFAERHSLPDHNDGNVRVERGAWEQLLALAERKS